MSSRHPQELNMLAQAAVEEIFSLRSVGSYLKGHPAGWVHCTLQDHMHNALRLLSIVLDIL